MEAWFMVHSGTKRKACAACGARTQARSVPEQRWGATEEGKRLPESRRRRYGDGVPDNPCPDLRTQADFGAGNGIEAEAADTGGTDVGKRVGGATLFVAVIGSMRLRRRIVQALA
jgi:hypothetical protein